VLEARVVERGLPHGSEAVYEPLSALACRE
jgi:hypothetical protein